MGQYLWDHQKRGLNLIVNTYLSYQPNFAVKAETYMGEVTTLHTYIISIITFFDAININN